MGHWNRNSCITGARSIESQEHQVSASQETEEDDLPVLANHLEVLVKDLNK